MFSIGDKVVYPMHGAGVIEAIEEREVLGERRRYYVMRLSIGDMRIMIPFANVEDRGIRQVVDEEDFKKIIAILQEKKSPMSGNWHRRYRVNLDKMKSGDIFAVAEVVRNLVRRDQEKGLSTGERKMLDNARQILISELVLVRDDGPEQVEDLLSKLLA
ncbi:CarD family transcriptional regulator [Heliorestis acidaminivorans]|uniref:CarD family transcriptional regulator n=1 Tax=Heliorestis acidaminivorans TaxID=553427 RepID=A0A6I0F047_9FIRM|nr:CarD family transcriptional regulator [Heliorestis acidaminivorans]KAB2951439.1 CarD family transcriptional regulator [Heliorestis acidaminivorans]